MSLEYRKPLPITKNWKLITTLGGKQITHARGCDFISEWDVMGCQEIPKLKLTKHKLCPSCSYLSLATLGAKDYIENLPKYKKYLKSASYNALVDFYETNKAKTEFIGKRLYVQCNEDNWYIDFEFGVQLFHNDYNMKQRDENSSWRVLGYHEHSLKSNSVSEAIKKIAQYDYKKAQKAHEKKREKRPRITFSELDPEYWGFESEY